MSDPVAMECVIEGERGEQPEAVMAALQDQADELNDDHRVGLLADHAQHAVEKATRRAERILRDDRTRATRRERATAKAMQAMKKKLRKVRETLRDDANQPEGNNSLRSYQRELRANIQRFHVLIATALAAAEAGQRAAKPDSTDEEIIEAVKVIWRKLRKTYCDLAMGAGKSLTIHLLVMLYQHKWFDLGHKDHSYGLSPCVHELFAKIAYRICLAAPAVDNKAELLKEGLDPGFGEKPVPARLGLLGNAGLCSKLGLDEQFLKDMHDEERVYLMASGQPFDEAKFDRCWVCVTTLHMLQERTQPQRVAVQGSVDTVEIAPQIPWTGFFHIIIASTAASDGGVGARPAAPRRA